MCAALCKFQELHARVHEAFRVQQAMLRFPSLSHVRCYTRNQRKRFEKLSGQTRVIEQFFPYAQFNILLRISQRAFTKHFPQFHSHFHSPRFGVAVRVPCLERTFKQGCHHQRLSSDALTSQTLPRNLVHFAFRLVSKVQSPVMVQTGERTPRHSKHAEFLDSA